MRLYSVWAAAQLIAAVVFGWIAATGYPAYWITTAPFGISGVLAAVNVVLSKRMKALLRRTSRGY